MNAPAPIKRNAAQRKAEKRIEDRFKIWLRRHGLNVCILTGRHDCDLIHIREHTGASIKPEPRHTLPLARALHDVQETGGDAFWTFVNLPGPRDWSERLFECFQKDDPESAAALFADAQAQADRESLRLILEGQVKHQKDMT